MTIMTISETASQILWVGVGDSTRVRNRFRARIRIRNRIRISERGFAPGSRTAS